MLQVPDLLIQLLLSFLVQQYSNVVQRLEAEDELPPLVQSKCAIDDVAMKVMDNR